MNTYLTINITSLFQGSFIVYKAGDLMYIGTVALKSINRTDKDGHFHIITGARNPTEDPGRYQSCSVYMPTQCCEEV